MRSVTILGSTGSIGTQALDVVRHNPDRFKVVGLSAAGTNQELLVGQIREFLPPFVAIADEGAAQEVRDRLGDTVRRVELLVGPQAGEQLAADTEADMVLNGLVGSQGLGPTLAALQSGKTLALANKESLVVGGDLVMDLIKGEPERLIPVDSEHAALALALRGERREDLKRVVITGSGGPFRGWSRTELSKASMKEALQHPVWSMGPKITIDSATLMNKGLEVIEAHYLFGLEYSQTHVLIHPEGLVHAIAAFLALILLVVIPIHELGHLLVARRFGFKVSEYFVGFGPKLWSRRRGELEYGLKAIPAGGYVKIAGMNPYETVAPEDLPRAYNAKPRWQRALVILAGPLSHFLVGAMLYFLAFATYGDPYTDLVIVEEVAPTLNGAPSPASEAGLHVGDVVVRVGDLERPSDASLSPYVTRHAREHPGEPLEYVVDRDGRLIRLSIVPQ